MGDRHIHAKTLSGFGSAKVIELKESDRSGTYRMVYTVSGIATPKQEIDMIKRRLKEAESRYKELMRER